MAKQLDAIILPDSMQWPNRLDWTGISRSKKRTLGGGLVIIDQPLQRGQPIELVARDSVTWLDLATIEALQVLASAAGATYPLIWESANYTVMIDAIQFRPIWPHHDQHTGRIQLTTV